MDSFIAKQAITDENLTIVGYELLFRNSEKNRYPEGVSESLATKKIIWQQFVDDTIDRVVESDKLCFINFPEDLLIDGYAEILPKDKVVIEVLENTIPTEKLLSVIRGLREKGYLFALDDVTRTVFENWHDYLSLFDFVKIDTRRIDDDFLKLFFSL
ncbi:TPA: diguanylate phosphodiesterase, partial [Vibrio cholerae O1]